MLVGAEAVAVASVSERGVTSAMTDPGHQAKTSTREARSENAARSGAGTPRRRPRPLPTVLAALACFAVAFEFLAFQLRAGNDPALGNKAAVTRQAKPARRIVITKVLPPTSGAATGSGASTASSSAAAAPAPAPVTTGSS